MRFFQGSLLCLVVVGSGVLGAVLDAAPTGRLVESEAERASIVGAACYGQETNLVYICSGGENSDCSGCGCVYEHPVKDADQGYAAPKVNCKDDSNCQFEFRRGSCKGI